MSSKGTPPVVVVLVALAHRVLVQHTRVPREPARRRPTRTAAVIPFIRPRGVVQAVTQVAVELQPVILALAAEAAEAVEDIWAAAVVVPILFIRLDIMQDRLAVAVAVRHTGVHLSRTSIRESEVPERTFSSMAKPRLRERSHKWEYY
jgi:hypothetical protein